jgi:hypothetical protein
MMHALGFAAFAAGALAIAPISASADTIQMPISFLLFGDTDQNFVSTEFAGFDPKLGTLTSASISVSGTVTWLPGPQDVHNPSATLLMVLSPIPGSQTFISSNPDAQDINVDLNGAAAGAAIGPGPQTELLLVTDSSDGTFDRTSLDGVVTYTFTPSVVPVPESSTWAMMLVGFAGLGYAAFRRKGAFQGASA